MIALSEELRASHAVLMFARAGESRPAMLLAPRSEPDRIARYRDRFFSDDPFVDLPRGEVTPFNRFVRRARGSFERYLEGSVGTQILGVDFEAGPRITARLRVTRALTGPDFSRRECAALQTIAPQFALAVRAASRLAEMQSHSRLLREALIRTGRGTIVIDAARRIVDADSSALTRLEAGDGLCERNGILRLRPSAADQALGAILRGAEHHSPGTEPLGELRIGAPSQSLTVFASSGGPSFLLVLGPRGAPRAPAPEALADAYGLTPAEARLARAIFDGTPLPLAAGRLGITHNTARAHLRSIFAKAGVGRQSELVALMHRFDTALSAGRALQ